MGIKATQVEDVFENEGIPGAYQFTDEDPPYIIFVCPCGCGQVLNIPVMKGPKVDGAWQWDGNRDVPTLHPSIKRLDGCKWHGWLRNGVWEGA